MAYQEPDGETKTLRHILNISDAALDQAMGIAYQLYVAGHLPEAEIICRGLIACDHRYWWSHSLHASVLRRLGRHEEALDAVERGLQFEPGQPKLALMRSELRFAIARKRATLGPANVPALTSASSKVLGTPPSTDTGPAP